MNCKYCKKEIPGDGLYCPYCGRKQERAPHPKQRGNGQGTVVKLANGKYKAVVTLGYITDEDGKRRRKTRSKTCDKKKDAVAAIPDLLSPRREEKESVTFKALYDKWLPTHRAGKDTLNCYRAAMKHFEPVWFIKMADLDVDDLQECLDGCPHGKRTRENMKTVCGLVYKYGIPRQKIPENLNLAPFLTVTGEGAAHRASFNDVELEKIKKACGSVPHAEDIYCLCYLGFRPSEFLALTDADYDAKRGCITGGAKTEAGICRTVTVSPKIKPIVDAHAKTPGPLFRREDGSAWTLKSFTELAFYPALEQIGIANPIVEIAGGKTRHKFTPHSCRHTFATLMKRVAGSDRDKQELIGHASGEQLKYYQDIALDDLRKITDAI